MKPYDFHHHKKNLSEGIYNLELYESPIGKFSAGIHPKDLKKDNATLFEWLMKVAKRPDCIAIGECGLDAIIDVPENLQREAFKKQILLANELNKPVIIHCVRKFHELGSFKKIAKVPMIVHGFNKKKSIANTLLEQGFYLSFGEAALHQLSLQEILKDFPIQKMFLETDDADFEIIKLYEKVAEIKQIPTDDLQNQLKANLEEIIYG